MIDDFHVRLEPGFRRFFGIGFQIVHAADAIEHVESQARIVAQELADRKKIFGSHNDKGILRFEILGLDPWTELLVEYRAYFRSLHCMRILMGLEKSQNNWDLSRTS